MAIAKFQTNTVTVADVLAHHPKSMIPQWFQRNIVWSRLQAVRYIQSVFDGEASTPFVVCGIRKCNERHPSTNYDYLVKENHEYIVLDAQNRYETLHAFKFNKITWTGTVEDRGEEYSYVNTFYKDMEPCVQHAFDDAILVWQEYVNIAFEDLPKVFRRLNDGDPLNRQEKRNAEQTYVAAWVRARTGEDATRTFAGAMGHVFTKEQKQRMVDGEYLSKFLLFASEMYKTKGATTRKVPSPSPKKLDEYYAKGKGTFSLKHAGFDSNSMSKYCDGELDFLDNAVKFHAAAGRAYAPTPEISASPTAAKNISILLLSIWIQTVIWSQGKQHSTYGLNKDNFLHKILSTDYKLQQEDKTGTGYRELTRVNWQGAIERCNKLLKRLEEEHQKTISQKSLQRGEAA